jgi:hypothetical protein
MNFPEFKKRIPGMTSFLNWNKKKSIPGIIVELKIKKRAIVQVKVDLYNSNNEKLFTSVFDWFLALN